MNITRLTPDTTGLVDWPLLSRDKKAVVTVGTFDGLHRGHQAVVRRVIELAKATKSFSVVIMFDPRPALVHAYAHAHDDMPVPADFYDAKALTSVDQRLREFDAMGVDHVLVVRYDLAFASKSFRFFLGQLVGKLGMRTLVLGSDATMGAGKTGDIKAIKNLSLATGVFELDVVDDRGPGYTRVPAKIEPLAPPTDHLGDPEDAQGDGQGRAARLEQGAPRQERAGVELVECALSARAWLRARGQRHPGLPSRRGGHGGARRAAGA